MAYQPQLLAHWPLDGDARDVAGDHHGHSHGVTYAAGPRTGGAAVFDGIDSTIRVNDHPRLRLGSADFTVTAWIRCATPMTHALGDIVSKFDPAGRSGLNLSVSGSAPAYSGMSDQRHVHFGIDDGCDGVWEDLGKPEPTASHVTALVTWRGALYAGIADALEPDHACRVFGYGGQQTWHDCGRLCSDPNVRSVQSMLVHDGKLVAGSGNWDWVRAKGKAEGFTPSHVHVYEYQNDRTWRDLGQVGHGRRIMAMVSFDGCLYAGLDAGDGGGKVYRCDGSTWQDCGAPDGSNVEGLLASRGRLYAATHGCVYRYEADGTWARIAHYPHGINQIHCITERAGRLWIGTWPQGYVMRCEAENDWRIVGRLGIPEGLHECNEVMDLQAYNGKLYAGLIPKAQVWRYETDGNWTLLTSLARRDDWKHDTLETWCRVTCLGVHAGRLCAATGTCLSRADHQDARHELGRVHAFTAGQVASHEHDIAGEWTHLAAARAGAEIKLYVNGRLRAVARNHAGVPLDLTNATALTIGDGAQTRFHGSIADVRLYDGAFDDAAAAALCR